MKSIVIELNKKTTSQTTEIAIVQNIERNLKLVDDTNDRYDHLRFIKIDGEDISIDLNDFNIELRRISNPRICVSIAKTFVHAVEVEI